MTAEQVVPEAAHRTTPSLNLRYPELQGQRGLAALSIVVAMRPRTLSVPSTSAPRGAGAAAFWPTVTILMPLSLLVAWASYWLIEYPSSQLRFFLGAVPSRELQQERRHAP